MTNQIDDDDFVNQAVAGLGQSTNSPAPGTSGGGAYAAVSTTTGQAPSLGDDDYLPYYVEASKATGVPINLLQAVVQTESSGNPKAVSSAGAIGLGQLMPATAASLGVTDPTDPQQNIMGTAKYLKQGLDAYGGDITKALQFYQGGPNTEAWGPQNAAYPGKVLANLKTPSNPAQEAFNDDDFIAQATKQFPAPSFDVGPGTSSTSSAPQTPATVKENLTPAQQAQLRSIETQGVAPNTTTSTASPVTPNVNPGWGANQELAQKMTLGGAIPLAAGIGAGIAALHGKNPFTMYSADYQQQEADKQAWEQAHPGETTTASVLGPVPSMVAGGGLASGAIRAAAPALEAVSPFAGRAIAYLGGDAGTGAGGLAKAGSAVTRGAIEGGAAGALGGVANPQNGSIEHQALTGAEAGGVLGGAANAVGQVVIPGIKNSITGLSAQLDNLGVHLPTGVVAGNPIMRAAAGNGNGDVLGQYTSALREQIGLEPKPSLTSQDIDTAKATIGDAMATTAGKIGIDTQTNPVVGDRFMGGLKNLYLEAVPLAQTQTPATMKNIMGSLGLVAQLAQKGDIAGSDIQGLLRKGGLTWSMQKSSDPLIQHFGNELRGVLDQGLQDTATAKGDTSDLNSYMNLRNQYRIASKLEPIVDKAGGEGVVNPKLVANAFSGEMPGTPMKTLADGGRLIPTAARSGGGLVHELAGHTVSKVVGGALGALAGGPSLETITGGALAGTAAKMGLERALNSNLYRNALTGGWQAPAALGTLGASGLNNLYNSPNAPPKPIPGTSI